MPLFPPIFYNCDLKLYLKGDILLKVDRSSMFNSLEVRVSCSTGSWWNMPPICSSCSVNRDRFMRKSSAA
jgi:hypothetical protein